MKMYAKTMKHRRKKSVYRRAIKHAERRVTRLFCRRWANGEEIEG